MTDYIGKPLNSLPDGSVAVVGYKECCQGTEVYMIDGGKPYLAQYQDGRWFHSSIIHSAAWLDRPIIAVLQLGKQRPRTLGEVLQITIATEALLAAACQLKEQQ